MTPATSVAAAAMTGPADVDPVAGSVCACEDTACGAAGGAEAAPAPSTITS